MEAGLCPSGLWYPACTKDGRVSAAGVAFSNSLSLNKKPWTKHTLDEALCSLKVPRSIISLHARLMVDPSQAALESATAESIALKQTGEGEAGSGQGVSQRCQFEQKLFKSLTNPEPSSSKTDLSLLPRFCYAGSEEVAHMSEIYQTCSFCVLIFFFFPHCCMESFGNIYLNVYILSFKKRS